MGGVRPARWLATALLILALATAGPAAAAGVYHCQSYNNSYTYSGSNSSYDGYVALKGEYPQGTDLAPNSCWDTNYDSWGFGFSLENVTGSTLGAPASIQWVSLTMDFYDNTPTKIHSVNIPGSEFGGWFDESFQDLSHGPHAGDTNWLDPDDLAAACFCTHFGSHTPGYIALTWSYEVYLYVTTTYALVENTFSLTDPGVGKWYKVNVPSGLEKVRYLIYASSGSISGWASSGSRFYKVSQAEFTIGTASTGSWRKADMYTPSSGYTYVYVSDKDYGGSSEGGEYTASPSGGSGELKVQFYCDNNGSSADLAPESFLFSVPTSVDGVTPGVATYSIYVPSGTNSLDVGIDPPSASQRFYLTTPGGTDQPENQGSFTGSVATGCWKLTMENLDQSSLWSGSSGDMVVMYSGNNPSEQTEADYNNNGTWKTSIGLSSGD